MKSRYVSTCSAVITAALGACLLLPACDPVDDPNAKVDTWKPYPDPPRRLPPGDPNNQKWMEAWRDLRGRLAPLEARLAELQKLHTESNFDSFLTLDLEPMSEVQLGSLYHFLERGYFTVERRVLLQLLERRLNRTDPVLAIPAGRDSRPLQERLATAMHRDEIRMVDLESAIKYYEDTVEENFQVPTGLSPEATEELRERVGQLREKTLWEIKELDWKIASRQAEAFPGEYPEPGPPPEPVKVAPVVNDAAAAASAEDETATGLTGEPGDAAAETGEQTVPETQPGTGEVPAEPPVMEDGTPAEPESPEEETNGEVGEPELPQ